MSFFNGDLKQLFPQIDRSVTAVLQIALPDGAYEVRRLDPLTGEIIATEIVQAIDGKATLNPITVEQDLAFGIRRKK